MTAAALVTTRQGRPSKEKTSDEVFIDHAVAASGVPRTAIDSARTVLRDGTLEEVQAVKTGKAKVRATADKIRTRKKAAKEPALKVATADAVRSAPTPPKATPSPPSDAPFEIENLVLAYEARAGRFPTADEIAEALEISEADAATGLAAVVKARKAGGAQPIQFREAQKKHVEAFEEALKRRYYKITEAEQRKLLLAQREAFKDIAQRAERQAGMIRELATNKLAEWAEAHAVFDVAEWRLLNIAVQSNPTDETRHKASQLLNERAFLATGGKMGTPDDIERAKRTRAEIDAEKAAKAKATRDANKAAKSRC
jgi:hypothetical protein